MLHFALEILLLLLRKVFNVKTDITSKRKNLAVPSVFRLLSSICHIFFLQFGILIFLHFLFVLPLQHFYGILGTFLLVLKIKQMCFNCFVICSCFCCLKFRDFFFGILILRIFFKSEYSPFAGGFIFLYIYIFLCNFGCCFLSFKRKKVHFLKSEYLQVGISVF